jgi:hypothetical protein
MIHNLLIISWQAIERKRGFMLHLATIAANSDYYHDEVAYHDDEMLLWQEAAELAYVKMTAKKPATWNLQQRVAKLSSDKQWHYLEQEELLRKHMAALAREEELAEMLQEQMAKAEAWKQYDHGKECAKKPLTFLCDTLGIYCLLNTHIEVSPEQAANDEPLHFPEVMTKRNLNFLLPHLGQM